MSVCTCRHVYMRTGVYSCACTCMYAYVGMREGVGCACDSIHSQGGHSRIISPHTTPHLASPHTSSHLTLRTFSLPHYTHPSDITAHTLRVIGLCKCTYMVRIITCMYTSPHAPVDVERKASGGKVGSRVHTANKVTPFVTQYARNQNTKNPFT